MSASLGVFPVLPPLDHVPASPRSFTEWRRNYNGKGWSEWEPIEDMLLKQEHGDREPYWMVEFR